MKIVENKKTEPTFKFPNRRMTYINIISLNEFIATFTIRNSKSIEGLQLDSLFHLTMQGPTR